MPRYPGQSSLPPLATTLPQFEALDEESPKIGQIADWLRKVVAAYRTPHNLTFYTTRDIARFFKTSQYTAALAVERLESEGMLRRIRGSRTLMLGQQIITRTRIRAVAGLASWLFGQRYSEFQKGLTQNLAQELWPRQIALNLIPYNDQEIESTDLEQRLRKHRVDFVIWPFPFAHHREPLRALEKRGVRNLVIGVEGVRYGFTPDIVIDYRTPYANLLEYWREEHGIQRIVVVSPREFTPRRRIQLFVKMAQKAGFDCQVEPSSERLPADLLQREREKIGIALLDEHASVEFTFYDPSAFGALLERHRVLYGSGTLNVPFVPHGKHRVERIFVPLKWGHSIKETPVIPAIAERLEQWCYGDFSAPPSVIPAILWRRGELWRYL